MMCPTGRIKASAERVLNLSKDKEALAVLALNDAAVRSRKGRFFYLPESTKPYEKCSNSFVKIESIVPKLLYSHHQWSDQESEEYWQNNDASRYLYIQCTFQL